MRSLIADLGDAYCVELRRTAIGPFEVARRVAPPRRGEPWTEPPLIPLTHGRRCRERVDPQ